MIRGVSEGEGIRRVSDMKELVGVGVGGGDSGLVRLVHTKNGLFSWSYQKRIYVRRYFNHYVS